MDHTGSHVLVVDDDKRLRDLLSRYLREQGFVVSTAVDAADARTQLEDNIFDLMVLDVMMPGESGLELMESLRNDKLNPASNIPILILTAMSETDDRIKGLELGADDYLPKPFDPKELFLRILTILRRMQPTASVQKVITLGKHSFDVQQGRLYLDNNLVALSSVESNLLRTMAMHPGRPLSRDELARRGGVALSPRTIDVQVTRLRRKIEPNAKNPIYIQTVRHKGYVLWPD